jgi:hypothetical protein
VIWIASDPRSTCLVTETTLFCFSGAKAGLLTATSRPYASFPMHALPLLGVVTLMQVGFHSDSSGSVCINFRQLRCSCVLLCSGGAAISKPSTDRSWRLSWSVSISVTLLHVADAWFPCLRHAGSAPGGPGSGCAATA